MTQGACRECGCRDLSACWDEAAGGPCFWVERDLCSRCAGKVSDEQMAFVKRVSLLHQAMTLCLSEGMGPVLVVLQKLDDPTALTYTANTDRVEVERLLRFLLDSFPDTPSIPTEVTIEVSKSFSPPQDPDRRN